MDIHIHQHGTSKKTSTLNEGEVNILHLSDLHYGIEQDATRAENRRRFRQNQIFKKLIETLKNDDIVPVNWKPDVIVISGDIAWRGNSEEYTTFNDEFIVPLTNALGLTKDKIITCPGNHDIIRDRADGFERPYRDQKKLQVKNISRDSIEKKRSTHFENYVKILCAGDPQKLCTSIILPEWPWVRFLVMNSAWDCRDNNDEGTLRVGLDLLEEIAGEEKDGEIIVSVFHHPHTEVDDFDIKSNERKKRNWLHISEVEPEQDDGICFTNFLERRSDFILNGHIHKETRPKHSKDAKSIQLISGAAYSTDTPKYHCRILKLRYGDESLYRDLRCTLGSGDCSWEVTSQKDFRVFGYIHTSSLKKTAERDGEKKIIERAQAAINLEDTPQNSIEMKRALQEVVQYILSKSSVDNKFENEKPLEQSKESILATGSALRLKGPR